MNISVRIISELKVIQPRGTRTARKTYFDNNRLLPVKDITLNIKHLNEIKMFEELFSLRLQFNRIILNI